MSHLKERTEKKCLNCNAHVHGKYCHICGQENLEPAESAWHLISHFFNDITHFDGKFFSTLKLLITKPGFLSAEYKRGRRSSYLNPVRMYIFTSFIFFIVVFKLYPADKPGLNSMTVSGYSHEEIAKMDSTEFKNFTKVLTRGRELTRQEYPLYVDSLFTQSGNSIFGLPYETEAEYDSLRLSGKLKETWLEQKFTAIDFSLRKQYKNQQAALEGIWDKLLHNFPKILFISLPFFTLFLSLIFIRKKDTYFVSHGIYAIHLYIFYFIILLALFTVGVIEEKTRWEIDWMRMILMIWLFIYEYKAMRTFYGQRRAKTILKFLLAFVGRLLIMLILLFLFLLLSVYNY